MWWWLWFYLVSQLSYMMWMCVVIPLQTRRRVDSPPVISDSSRFAKICSFLGLVCRQSASVWWSSWTWNPIQSIVIEFRLLGQKWLLICCGFDIYHVGCWIHSTLSRVLVWYWSTYSPLYFAIRFCACTWTHLIVHWVCSGWFTLD